MKIVLTGANGQLGREIMLQQEQKKGSVILPTDIGELDITNLEDVYAFAKQAKPDVIINCAGYTAVDKCETEVDTAYKVNVVGPRNLAVAAQAVGAGIVHISTDYVFDGRVDRPLTEFDAVGPQSVYGKTKLEGELLVRSLNPKHYIVRTAWLYGDGNNFVKTMLQLSQTNKTIKVVNDQKGTPTSAVDLARVILQLVEEKSYGLYHCTCQGACTWYEFACEIFRLKGIEVDVVPCTTEEFPRPAKRPEFSVLRNYMLELTTGDTTRQWQEAIREYLLALH